VSVDVFDTGWLEGVQRLPSPNHDERPAGEQVRLAVIHAISLPPDQFGGPGVMQIFTNTLDPAEHPYYAGIFHLRVSAHFFIRRDGHLIQFVPIHRRAWHAGVSSWQGRERCNDFSVGIELEGCDSKPFEPVQYQCLARLLARLQAIMPLEAVCGHSDIAPGRKTDPGPFFFWPVLAEYLVRCDAGSMMSLLPLSAHESDIMSKSLFAGSQSKEC
jgi:N-acetyl-anhydromuramoyl-L-alanine amidase